MSVRKVLYTTIRYSSSRHGVNTGKSSVNMELIQRKNSSEYALDGEKIECGLKYNPSTGDKTEEKLSMIVEMARAKTFDDSLKNVASMKITA